MTAAIAASASSPLPSASRQSDRYCSMDFVSVPTVGSAGRMPFSSASASSYRADAYRSRAVASCDSCADAAARRQGSSDHNGSQLTFDVHDPPHTHSAKFRVRTVRTCALAHYFISTLNLTGPARVTEIA